MTLTPPNEHIMYINYEILGKFWNGIAQLWYIVGKHRDY